MPLPAPGTLAGKSEARNHYPAFRSSRRLTRSAAACQPQPLNKPRSTAAAMLVRISGFLRASVFGFRVSPATALINANAEGRLLRRGGSPDKSSKVRLLLLQVGQVQVHHVAGGV